MMRRLRRGEFHIDFIGRTRLWLVITAAVVAVSIGSLVIRNINAGLEFRGGTSLEVQARDRTASVTEVRDALERAGVDEATVQRQGERGFLIQTRHLSSRTQEATLREVAGVTGVDTKDVNVQDVGPKWGRQITNKAIRALVVFLVVVAIYLSIRLEPKMAGAAMVAVGHDVVATAGIYSLSGLVVTPATVIAFLTVLGYSLYDTVVIFDRVKERSANLSAAGNVTYSASANASLNQVLARSISTSVTALLPVGSLLFVGSFLLGAQTLRELALALFVGLTAGAYSSIFVATPVLARWKEREARWATLRTRIAARSAGEAPVPPAPRVAAPVPSTGDVAAQAGRDETGGAPTVPEGLGGRPPGPATRPARSVSQPKRRKKRKRRKR